MTPEQKEAFVQALGAFVPEQLLAFVVRDHKVVPDYDGLVKRATQSREERRVAVARAVLDAYTARNLAHRLAEALRREMRWHREFQVAAAPIAIPPDEGNQEAFLARRDHFFRANDLMRKLEEHLPRVCCIVGRYEIAGEVKPRSGTGFLVGPDLVLTTMHVFGTPAEAALDEVPRRFAVYFDHVEGEPLAGPNDRRNHVRRVNFAEDWLVASSPPLEDDGKIDEPDERMIARMRERFDVALVRLAEEIGLETLRPTGGPRRSWIPVPLPGDVALDVDSRIVIPQHPFGNPRSIDFGRFKETCCSGTRIRYDVETAPGTSGAPCFDRSFHLVGMHNAACNVPDRNQAIYLDAFEPLVRAHLTNVERPKASVRLWNVSPDPDAPHVVIGRKALLDFLDAGLAGASTRRAGRIYAAIASGRGSGKTFTVEILRAALADKPAHRTLVLGSSLELLPSRVEDLVRVLANGLAVPASELARMPARPGPTLPSDSLDGDKLRRWASVILPRWFLEVLEQHRVVRIDKAQAARAMVEQDRIFARKTPGDIVALANSQHPIFEPVEMWSDAWIALDRLPETTMTPEVKDFLAGMTGVGTDESSLLPVQRRLRWLFLGYCPDFLTKNDVTAEILDPAQISQRDIEVMLESASATFNQNLSSGEISTLSRLIILAAKTAANAGLHPSKRYAQLQELITLGWDEFLPRRASA